MNPDHPNPSLTLDRWSSISGIVNSSVFSNRSSQHVTKTDKTVTKNPSPINVNFKEEDSQRKSSLDPRLMAPISEDVSDVDGGSFHGIAFGNKSSNLERSKFQALQAVVHADVQSALPKEDASESIEHAYDTMKV
eukprot:720995-Amorphochlora_amoeboformis.AAC.1